MNDSTRYQGQQGWFTIGGTSASSPMWAGAGAAVAGAVVKAAYVYGNNITYRDITVRKKSPDELELGLRPRRQRQALAQNNEEVAHSAEVPNRHPSL